jgi:N-acetyl-gamma-glutamyl-phosphate reductase
LIKTAISSSTKVIDLSTDFRLKNDAIFQGREFVYGLPELHKEKIKNAR